MSGSRIRALVEQARATEVEVRRHKRAAREHRLAARDAATRLAAIRRECERLGIALTFAPPPRIPPDNSPGRAATADRA